MFRLWCWIGFISTFGICSVSAVNLETMSIEGDVFVDKKRATFTPLQRTPGSEDYIKLNETLCERSKRIFNSSDSKVYDNWLSCQVNIIDAQTAKMLVTFDVDGLKESGVKYDTPEFTERIVKALRNASEPTETTVYYYHGNIRARSSAVIVTPPIFGGLIICLIYILGPTR
ncbi:unnamed protein product [Dicrocoelium dendriticum]|nr:unnamed protein product [Dicrocoelium dendriticum]